MLYESVIGKLHETLNMNSHDLTPAVINGAKWHSDFKILRMQTGHCYM